MSSIMTIKKATKLLPRRFWGEVPHIIPHIVGNVRDVRIEQFALVATPHPDAHGLIACIPPGSTPGEAPNNVGDYQSV